MSERVTIVSDASVCPTTGAAGYGFWCVSNRGRHAGGGAFKTPSRNPNLAEIMAIANALHVALALGIAAAGDRILIQTDSICAIDVLDGRTRRRKALEHLFAAGDAYQKRKLEHSLTVEFRHVKGHSKVEDSRSLAQRHADRRARKGMKDARATLTGSRKLKGKAVT